MELKEAKEILKEEIESHKHALEISGALGSDGSLEEKFRKEIEVYETFLKELDRLQKENTMLENTKMNCPHFNTSGVSCDKEFCNLDDYISKDKIRKVMDDDSFEVWTREYGNVDVVSLDSLNDLLKEE